MNYKQISFPLLVLASSFTAAYAQESGKDSAVARALRNKIETGQAEISNYNTACYFALAADPNLAFAYLKKAVYDDKFSNLKGIEKDTDFSSLHGDPRWKELIKVVAQNGAKKNASFVNDANFWESKALKTPYQQNISEDEKIAGLSKFWSEAKYNFVNFDLIPELDFDALYYAYLPKVKQSKSTAEYYKLMMEFCAHLKDGHTNVMVPKELVNDFYGKPLIRTRLVEDKVLILGVFDADLEKKGIKVGQEVVMVNGLPVKEYAAKYVTPYESASTPQDIEIRAYDYALLAGSVNEPIALQLRDEKGKTSNHIVLRVKPMDRPKTMSTPPFEYKLLKGNIALVSLNSFGTDSAAKAFAINYPEISKADAIIFDVRANGGGDSSVGWEILGYLVDKPAAIHSWYTRYYRPSYRAWEAHQAVFSGRSSLKPNGKNLYTKPVIVLTGARSYSAAEDFAAAFKSLNRGLIIGKATGGSSGQPLTISMPGNGNARFCTKRDMLANGEDFVGKGVQPDQLVAPTVADTRKGIDTELAAAIKALKK
ncbi:S41 family peptidase [Pedobacter gandavensis]|uniref:S41 family peptidase n=1 Tax=Pedobacter gandavensis TaxID=2679963 RepID=UPI00292EA46D|nr:S41 family peptidase [Pedobacter gandavensis]